MRSPGLAAAVVVATAAAALAPPASAEPPKVELGGGSGIVFGHDQPIEKASGACTLTAIGHDRDDRLVGLTNAHCFYDNDGHQWLGDEVYRDASEPGTSLDPNDTNTPDLETGVIGTVAHISGGNPIFPGPNGVGLDYAVIELDESKVRPTATIGETTITEIGPPPGAGRIVCKQGRTTGVTCGTMLTTSGDYFTHTIWELPGDSGAPVTAGTTLIGNQWVAGGSTSMAAIVDDLASNGEIGAGFRVAEG